jgi:hypothetical protein
MIEPDELHAAFSRVATGDEPPLTLDTDELVAAGNRRRRRTYGLRGAGVAVAAAAVLAVPVLVLNGPGGGGGIQVASGGPSVEPTPGAPHGGCQGQSHSSSTEAYRVAQWLRTQLPARQRYDTKRAWQVSYQTDCVDGARQDSTTAGFRVIEHAGDIDVALNRDTPAERAPRPCQPEYPGDAPNAGSSTSPARGHSGFTRCETTPLPDGSKLIIEELRRSPGADGLTVARMVAVWHPDGTVVTIRADNRVVTAPPASDAPLTVDEMVALAKRRDLNLYYPPTR